MSTSSTKIEGLSPKSPINALLDATSSLLYYSPVSSRKKEAFELINLPYFIILLLGLCLGSFYNVCISRIPKDESIISARSHCPHCKKTIPFYDLVPILSYIILRGRCRNCGGKISIRYPIVEALTAALLLLIVFLHGYSLMALMIFIFFSLLLIIAFIDLETLLIPDVLVISGAVIGLLLNIYFGNGVEFSAIGMAFGFAFMYALSAGGRYFLKKEAMGDGDIKLAVMLGALYGAKKLLLSVFIGSVSGLIIVLVLLISNRIKRDAHLPFGTFLAMGAFITFILGDEILKQFCRF